MPAGRYARAALRHAGLHLDEDGPASAELALHGVNGSNVRTALEWVASGNARMGIVYATDAAVKPRVKVAFTFTPDSHPPIECFLAARGSARACPASAPA